MNLNYYPNTHLYKTKYKCMKEGEYVPDNIKGKLTQEEFNYFVEFAKTLTSMGGMNYLLNPYISNQYLKNINMNPQFKDRDTVEKMVYNPKDNELGLRRLSEHLYNTQTPYKRLIHYFADMLKFDWYPIPINATEEDMKKDSYKKDWERMWQWFDKFDIKKEFKKILLGMMLEDAKFTYIRESELGIIFQEMPSDYCIVDAWSELGYLYSFNLLYFQQVGVDIRGFPPEFKKYYQNAMDMLGSNNTKYYPNIRPEMRNGRWMYWQEISPDKGWVFKFHNNFAGLVPPFLGLFIDAIEIDTFKEMQKTKTALDVYKIIFGNIPRHKDGTNKSGNAKDDMALSPEMAANYMKLIKNSLPEGVDFKASPLEDLKSFEFNNSASKANIVGDAMKNFYKGAGADQALFNSDKPNASTMKASTRVDASFVERVYEQFNTFCTYQLSKITKKYKFKIVFEGTIFDEDERKEQALTLAQNGIITPKLASSNGMTLKEFVNGMNMMKVLGFPDNLTPIQSSYTLSAKNNKGGKPEGDLTDSKVITDDAGSNINKKNE